MINIGVYPTTIKIFPDTIPNGKTNIKLYGAQNEILSFQVAVRSDSATILQLTGDIYEQQYISTHKKAKWGFPQPKSCYPDALKRVTSITLKANITTALWVRANNGIVKIGNQQISVNIIRWSWGIPRKPSLKTSIGLGGAGFARYYGTTLNSSAYFNHYKKYYDMLLDYRLSAYHLPFADINNINAKSYMNDERVTTFRCEGLNNTSWSYIKPTNKGWIYNFDEPTTLQEYNEIKSNAVGYHSMYPGIKYGIPFYTGVSNVSPFDYLVGSTNLWIPQTDYYFTKIKDKAKTRQRAGDELWLYTSWAPRQGYCNLMINQLAIEHRLLFWQLYAEGVTGYLYWHSTFWDWITDPWNEPATLNRSDPGIYGDGSLFYPLSSGASPSLRLELVREGMQDYELLKKAESVLGKSMVDEYVKKLTTSLVSYTTDYELFEQVRIDLGCLIENKLFNKEASAMVSIIQDFIPVGRRNRPGYKLNPTYITIHNTANPNVGAKAHSSYIKGDAAASIPASWHYSVDHSIIYQHLPLNENAWHCGDGSSGKGNRNSIGIEICEYTDSSLQRKAEENAAWLTAKLMKEYGIGIDNIKQHYNWSGKNCPRVLRGRAGGWEGYLNMVKSYLGYVAPPIATGTEIAGKSEAILAQAKKWAKGRGAHQRFIDIADIYWKYGELTGIRSDILYVQAAHETFFGKYTGNVIPEQNNWAGIKIKNPIADKRDDHAYFATPDDGVRAHFNHISAYVGLQPIGTPHDRYYVVKSMSWAGKVKYLEELAGKWAPSATYHSNIIKYLNEMINTSAPEPEPDPVIPVPGPVKPTLDHIMIFTFDDFFDSDYQLVFPLFQSLGLRGTSFMPTSEQAYVGQPMNNAKWKWAKEMVDSGWDIQCHTVTHSDLPTLSDAQIEKELEDANKAFVTHGLFQPEHHAYPRGLYDARVKTIIKKYRKSARTTTAATYDGIDMSNLDLYEMHPIGADMKTEADFTYLKDRLDQAYKNNRLVITIHHRTCEKGDENKYDLVTRVDLLKRIAEYAMSKGFNIMTLKEFYDLLHPISESLPEPDQPEPVEPDPDPIIEPDPDPEPEPEIKQSFWDYIVQLISDIIQNIIDAISRR